VTASWPGRLNRVAEDVTGSGPADRLRAAEHAAIAFDHIHRITLVPP